MAEPGNARRRRPHRSRPRRCRRPGDQGRRLNATSPHRPSSGRWGLDARSDRTARGPRGLARRGEPAGSRRAPLPARSAESKPMRRSSNRTDEPASEAPIADGVRAGGLLTQVDRAYDGASAAGRARTDEGGRPPWTQASRHLTGSRPSGRRPPQRQDESTRHAVVHDPAAGNVQRGFRAPVPRSAPRSSPAPRQERASARPSCGIQLRPLARQRSGASAS